MVDTVNQVYSNMVQVFENVVNALTGLMDLDFNLDIQIPDFLIPGSPTPFEIGLKGVKSAMSQINSLGMNIPVTANGQPFAPAGAGGGFAPSPSFGAPSPQQGNVTIVMDGEPVGRLVSQRQGQTAMESRGASIGGRANL